MLLRYGLTAIPLGHNQLIIDDATLDLTYNENGVPILGSSSSLTALRRKPRKLWVTFDGQPYNDIIVGTMAKVLPLDIAGALTRVRVTSDIATTCTLSIWKDILANGDPTIADNIVGSTPPGLTASEFYEDTTLTGWSTAVALTDVWMIKIATIGAGVKFLQLELEITPT